METTSISTVIFTQRATQAAIWAMPALGLIGVREGLKHAVGARSGDIVYFSQPVEAKHAILTANSQVPYVLSWLTTIDGPMVVEVPASSDRVFLFGTFVNAWDVPIADVGPDGHDHGAGSRYLFLPPGYSGETPDGYTVFQCNTYAVHFAFRPVSHGEGNWADGVALARSVRVYPLAAADNPPENRMIDASPHVIDTLTPFDARLFTRLADFVQTEFAREKDKAMLGLLAEIGIEKGREFTPDASRQKLLDHAGQLAFEHLQDIFTRPGGAFRPVWPDNSWTRPNISRQQATAGFPFETETRLLIDERAGGVYFFAIFLPRVLGAGSLYLMNGRDDRGRALNGRATYRLSIPAGVPARDFWSIQVYDLRTKSFIREVSKPGVSSLPTDGLQLNPDGSCDLVFAPKAVPGACANHIPTGRDFFVILRLYGPSQLLAETDWRPGEFRLVDGDNDARSAAQP